MYKHRPIYITARDFLLKNIRNFCFTNMAVFETKCLRALKENPVTRRIMCIYIFCVNTYIHFFLATTYISWYFHFNSAKLVDPQVGM